MSSLRFPINDIDINVVTGRILFEATRASDSASLFSIMLPMPKDVSISDSANYGTIDLGTIGGAEKEIQKQMAAYNAGDMNAGSVLNSLGVSVTGGMVSYLANQVPQNISDLAAYYSKSVLNPHTNTLFQSVEVRNFDFAFNLIAESEPESSMIYAIDSTFRQLLYPETDNTRGFHLKFPPVWNIKFLYCKGTFDEGAENAFLPKIHKCFLKSYTSTYNSVSNAYHKGGAPFDVAFRLGFQETKTYSFGDILAG